MEDPNIIDVAAPVITKLKNRINRDSLRRLPSQTYHVSKDIIFSKLIVGFCFVDTVIILEVTINFHNIGNADAVPQLHYCIGMLSTAAHRVRDVSTSTQAVARSGLNRVFLFLL